MSSCIIQVAQDIDEPWPVEVISHDGVAYNITMAPGDMVLYESHSILHGRPYPLVGRFYVSTEKVALSLNRAYPITPTVHDKSNESYVPRRTSSCILFQ